MNIGAGKCILCVSGAKLGRLVAQWSQASSSGVQGEGGGRGVGDGAVGGPSGAVRLHVTGGG